jgi:1-phosphofructokinase
LIAGKQGKFLQKSLQDAKISTDFLEIEGETRTNLKIFDRSVNKTTEINESGFYVSKKTLLYLKKNSKILLKMQKLSFLVEVFHQEYRNLSMLIVSLLQRRKALKCC